MNTILSNSGKKEATITYNITNGYVVMVNQLTSVGGNIVKDYFNSKFGFISYDKAVKWAFKILNKK